MTARSRLRLWKLLSRKNRRRRRLILICAFHDMMTGREWVPETLAWSRDVHVRGQTQFDKLQQRHNQVVALIDERSARTEYADLYSLLQEESRLVAACALVSQRTCHVRQDQTVQELIEEIKRVPHTETIRKQKLRERIRKLARETSRPTRHSWRRAESIRPPRPHHVHRRD